MMKKYGTLVIVLIVAVSAWLAGLPGQFIDTRPSEPVPQQTEQPQSIDALTAQARVVSYVQQHQRLPDYYVTKKAARNAGWQPSKGNLCEVMPGKAIGGDRFGNREKGCRMHHHGSGLKRTLTITAVIAAVIVCFIPMTG